MTAPPKRRWYQFSLRTLLIGVTLLAVACGWAVDHVRLVRERDEAASDLRKAEAELKFAGDYVGQAQAAVVRRIIAEGRRDIAEKRAMDAELLLELYLPVAPMPTSQTPSDAQSSGGVTTARGK